MGASTLDVRAFVSSLRDNGYGFADIKSELEELLDSQEKVVKAQKELVVRAQRALLKVQQGRVGECEPMQVFIKTLTGKTIVCRCKGSDTVLAVKEFIEEHEAIRPDEQRLICAGKQSDDNDILSVVGVTKESVMCLVVRLRGGMYHEISGRNGYADLRANELDSLIDRFEWNATQYERLTRRAEMLLVSCSNSKSAGSKKRKASD